MSAFRSIAEQVLHRAGTMHVVRATKKNQCRILMYHGFPGSSDEVRAQLARQCEHLRRYYKPISLSEIADALRTNAPLPPNGLAITVDDGYRDFRHAFPVFRSCGLSVTLYVVSEFAAGRVLLWPDRVKHAFRNSTKGEISIQLRLGEWRQFSAADPDSLEQVLMRVSNTERLAVMDALPDAALPGREPLTWLELRALAAQGLEIGAHTRTHPILSRVESPGGLADEIAGCKRAIEEALGSTVRHFCYPNGRREDYNDATIAAVREAGFETAVTTEVGLVKPGDDPFQLNRLGVEPDYPPLYFERCVAGFRR